MRSERLMSQAPCIISHTRGSSFRSAPVCRGPRSLPWSSGDRGTSSVNIRWIRVNEAASCLRRQTQEQASVPKPLDFSPLHCHVRVTLEL